MATTTNFGWETPDDTDLVKDGAAAIRTLGQSIDTSMADLEGGTTGQVLSKASNADMDFTWVAQDDSNAIQNAIVDAKGDLIAATAADTPARLAVGANDTVLTADSTTATGLKWAAPATGGGMTLISTTTLTGSTVSLTSFTGYKQIMLIVVGAYGGNQITFHGRFNSDSGNNYWQNSFTSSFGNVENRFTFGDGLSSGGGARNSSKMIIDLYDTTGTKPFSVWGAYQYWNNSAQNYVTQYHNEYVGTSAITSIDLYLSSGNFTAGTAYLYGIK